MFREISVYEIKEILRLWVRGKGLRPIEGVTGVDRKTVRRYIVAATAAGLVREGSEEQLTDGLMARVCEAVPAPSAQRPWGSLGDAGRPPRTTQGVAHRGRERHRGEGP